MNEEALNLGIRMFLKQFGIAAQREIEKAVDAGLRAGTVKGTERLKVSATLRIEGLEPEFTLKGEIPLG